MQKVIHGGVVAAVLLLVLALDAGGRLGVARLLLQLLGPVVSAKVSTAQPMTGMR